MEIPHLFSPQFNRLGLRTYLNHRYCNNEAKVIEGLVTASKLRQFLLDPCQNESDGNKIQMVVAMNLGRYPCALFSEIRSVDRFLFTSIHRHHFILSIFAFCVCNISSDPFSMDYFQLIFLFAFATGILIDNSWASPVHMGQETTQVGSDCTNLLHLVVLIS
jgi:hypothetical protein